MRSAPAPTLKVTRSASRAPMAMTLGPVAATSSGTLETSGESQRSAVPSGRAPSERLCAVGPEPRSPVWSNGTSPPESSVCSVARSRSKRAIGTGAMPR